ncbi:hypothetical protein [Deinococcus apachensis]|uniref:hypothetical protein n=1 Tax=Deinococcus apachensis TaxID=309886 RepID=UPI00037C63C9|nr:hypothetical protein [Deinococcus apachensis]
MDANKVAVATAEHLYRLYVLAFGSDGNREDAIQTTGEAVQSYLVNCGMSEGEAETLRDEIMLSSPF